VEKAFIDLLAGGVKLHRRQKGMGRNNTLNFLKNVEKSRKETNRKVFRAKGKP
jgi:hypothetical protein